MKKYLSFLLIPYLLATINCNYALVIDGTSFGFTLGENDVAEEFKRKLPLTIPMKYLPDSDLNLLKYNDYSAIWTKSYSSSSMKSNQIGSMTTSFDDNLFIYFAISESTFEIEFGKLENPNKLLNFLKSATTDSFQVSFIKIEENEEEEEKEIKIKIVDNFNFIKCINHYIIILLLLCL